VHLLLVDGDAGLRELVRTTFELVDVDVTEAANAAVAERAVAERPPDVVVVGFDAAEVERAELVRRLKSRRKTRSIPLVALSGDGETGLLATRLGADAFVPKPFSPLQLLAVAERLAGRQTAVPLIEAMPEGPDAQLLLYARDLRSLLELERGHRTLLQTSYREAVGALASALETRNVGGRGHPERVRRYALALARIVEPDLAGDPGLELGFLLHDVGMIGIPDAILRKPGPLDPDEWSVVRTHPQAGTQLLSALSLLRGEGIAIVRSHHERWDGTGYPDRLGARILALADTLDAMLTGREYRPPVAWKTAVYEIEREAGGQFDPGVVAAFGEAAPKLRALGLALSA
jgi:response regulator RpfG family c-di-GMP phosphodiesterase